MIEYPKVIDCGGVKVTVHDAEEEARWLKKDPVQPVPVEGGTYVVDEQTPAVDVEPTEPEPEPVIEEPASEPEPEPDAPKRKSGKKK
jgi:hypothetical protein